MTGDRSVYPAGLYPADEIDSSRIKEYNVKTEVTSKHLHLSILYRRYFSLYCFTNITRLMSTLRLLPPWITIWLKCFQKTINICILEAMVSTQYT
jgi:hypothetical protein